MNLRHETFIREMIAHGNRVQAYKAAYPLASDKTAIVNASRLMAKPAIRQRIENKQVVAEKQALTLLRDSITDKLTETIEKRKALALIIRGQVSAKKLVSVYNKVYQIEQGPTINQVLRAIELDSKLEASLGEKFR